MELKVLDKVLDKVLNKEVTEEIKADAAAENEKLSEKNLEEAAGGFPWDPNSVPSTNKPKIVPKKKN